jgi:hypothetical protein
MARKSFFSGRHMRNLRPIFGKIGLEANGTNSTFLFGRLNINAAQVMDKTEICATALGPSAPLLRAGLHRWQFSNVALMDNAELGNRMTDFSLVSRICGLFQARAVYQACDRARLRSRCKCEIRKIVW